jgi:hypothetical protein
MFEGSGRGGEMNDWWGSEPTISRRAPKCPNHYSRFSRHARWKIALKWRMRVERLVSTISVHIERAPHDTHPDPKALRDMNT